MKLSARLLYTHPEKFDLRKNFATYLRPSEGGPLKVDRFLVHWLLPLAIRMGTGRFGKPQYFSVTNADGRSHKDFSVQYKGNCEKISQLGYHF